MGLSRRGVVTFAAVLLVPLGNGTARAETGEHWEVTGTAYIPVSCGSGEATFSGRVVRDRPGAPLQTGDITATFVYAFDPVPVPQPDGPLPPLGGCQSGSKSGAFTATFFEGTYVIPFAGRWAGALGVSTVSLLGSPGVAIATGLPTNYETWPGQPVTVTVTEDFFFG